MLKVSKRGILQIILIYFLLMANQSVVFVKYGDLFYYVFLFVSILTILLYRSSLIFRNATIWISLSLLTFSIIIVRLTGGEAGITYIMRFASCSFLALATYYVDPQNAVRRFIDFTTIMAIISLVFYAISLAVPETLKSILGLSFRQTVTFGTIWENDYVWSYYGGLLYCLGRDPRNCGIYLEPGVYVTLLLSVMFLLVFYGHLIYKDNLAVLRRLFFILVTIITTASTAGFLCLAVILISVVFERNDLSKVNQQKIKRYCLYAIIIAVLAIISDFVLRGSDSLLNTVVFDKLSNISIDNYTGDSGSTRLVVILTAMEALKHYPLGAGAARMTEIASSFGFGTSGAGCGLFYYLGVLGIIGWLSIVGYIIWPTYKYKKSNVSFIAWLIIYIISTISQGQIFTPIFIIVSVAMKELYITQFNTKIQLSREVY